MGKDAVHIYLYIIILIHKKYNGCLLNNMNGSRKDYNYNKSDRGKQIPFDFIYTWNLKTRTNEQKSSPLIILIRALHSIKLTNDSLYFIYFTFWGVDFFQCFFFNHLLYFSFFLFLYLLLFSKSMGT